MKSQYLQQLEIMNALKCGIIITNEVSSNDVLKQFKMMNTENKVVMKYRTNDYFNATDTYLFEDLGKRFQSKVHLYNGSWYTNESLQFKATTIKCVKL